MEKIIPSETIFKHFKILSRENLKEGIDVTPPDNFARHLKQLKVPNEFYNDFLFLYGILKRFNKLQPQESIENEFQTERKKIQNFIIDCKEGNLKPKGITFKANKGPQNADLSLPVSWEQIFIDLYEKQFGLFQKDDTSNRGPKSEPIWKSTIIRDMNSFLNEIEIVKTDTAKFLIIAFILEETGILDFPENNDKKYRVKKIKNLLAKIIPVSGLLWLPTKKD